MNLLLITGLFLSICTIEPIWANVVGLGMVGLATWRISMDYKDFDQYLADAMAENKELTEEEAADLAYRRIEEGEQDYGDFVHEQERERRIGL